MTNRGCHDRENFFRHTIQLTEVEQYSRIRLKGTNSCLSPLCNRIAGLALQIPSAVGLSPIMHGTEGHIFTQAPTIQGVEGWIQVRRLSTLDTRLKRWSEMETY